MKNKEEWCGIYRLRVCLAVSTKNVFSEIIFSESVFKRITYKVFLQKNTISKFSTLQVIFYIFFKKF